MDMTVAGSDAFGAGMVRVEQLLTEALRTSLSNPDLSDTLKDRAIAVANEWCMHSDLFGCIVEAAQENILCGR